MAIAVVGAGIGGLTTALSCAAAGLEVEVFEQTSVLSELGAGLQLGANATRVLHRLGLARALNAIAVRPTAVHLRSWRNGRIIARRPLGAADEARYGAPYLQVHRADLQAVLLAAVQAAGVRINLQHRLASLTDGAGGVRLDFLVGETHKEVASDVCIGADGIHSRVREQLFGRQAPTFTGNLAWRASVPAESLPDALREPLATVWLGPSAHLVHYLVASGRTVNIVAIVERAHWQHEDWQSEGNVAEMRAAFAGWHPQVQNLLAAVQQCHLWGLFDRAPMPRWRQGRSTLLGDACHPMLPFLAQGAAMAIEDAWVLARALAHTSRTSTDADVGVALDLYEHARLPRTAAVQRAARAQARLFHRRSGMPSLARDFVLGVGSRALPALAQRRYDWLYAHDVLADTAD